MIATSMNFCDDDFKEKRKEKKKEKEMVYT